MEVVGNAANVAPEQIGATAVKAGTIEVEITIFIFIGVEVPVAPEQVTLHRYHEAEVTVGEYVAPVALAISE